MAKVKNAHLYAQTDSTKNVLEDILPELRESEDEKVISNNIDELNLLKEIKNYHEKYLAGRYITFAMYKRIARYFYFFGKKQK